MRNRVGWALPTIRDPGGHCPPYVAAALILAGALLLAPRPDARAADAPQEDGPLTILVMDPLAAPLACDCVEGYAQRKYEMLAMFLEKWLSCDVELMFSEALTSSVAGADDHPIDVVIGKHSLVNFDAKECDVAIRPIAQLTGKDGTTTLRGLFVVPASDPAKTIADLKGYRILFGPAASDEKHAAAVAALEKAGVSVSEEREISASCAEAGLACLESDAEPGTTALISSYAMALLEGCGTIDKGELRVIGETEPLPFITVFATEALSPQQSEKIVDALLAMQRIPPMLMFLETKQGFVKYIEPAKEAKPQPDEPTAKPAESAANDTSADGPWPQWRGPGRDGGVAWLPERLPVERNILWRTPMTGPGLAGVTVADGRVFVVDRDPSDRLDVFRCLAADTGRQLWDYQYPAVGELDYGNSPRAAPLVHNGHVYLLGAFGDLSCLKVSDGSLVWKKNFVRDFAAKLPVWGWCSSPLVVDGRLIVNPGAEDASLAALHLRTGAVVWQAPGRPAAYSSFIVGEFGGVRQIVGYDAVSLGGWAPNTGRRLWMLIPPESGDFNVPTPIDLGGRLLVATENNGTRLYGFDDRGAIIQNPLAEHFDLAPDTSTPVMAAGRVLGVWGDLFCLDPKDGLSERWAGVDEAYEDYASLVTDGRRLLITSAQGELLLVDAAGEEHQLLGRLRLIDDGEVLAHPALVDRRLYVRDMGSVFCVGLE